jgi:pimeloyl-ACP methyl ester carboxylesterase
MPTARIASSTGPIDLYYEETGHTVSIEEPGLFNQLVAEFLTSVESGRYGTWKGAAR